MQVKPFSPEDVIINGVRPKEVFTKETINKLGTPIEVRERNVEEGRFKYYIYSDFTVVTQFWNDNIEKIEEFQIIGSNFKTSRGISIGDEVEKLFSKYGKVNLEENCYYYEFVPKYNSERSYMMIVEIQNQKIKNIWYQ